MTIPNDNPTPKEEQKMLLGELKESHLQIRKWQKIQNEILQAVINNLEAVVEDSNG